MLERLGFGDLTELDEAALARHLTGAHDSMAAWCHAFRRRGGTGFFEGFANVASTVHAARLVDAQGTAAVIATAERALSGHFTLLGHEDLFFGRPTDWHLDPVLGVRSPRAHWSRIAYLDPAVSGDHKVVWELNRHQWMVSLAQAWRLTGDDRYATGCAQALDSWMDENPPKVGVNWASSLEIAFRAISWLWVLRLLGESTALGNRTLVRAAGHLRLAARHLERNLSTYFSPNTHLTGEALALYYLGSELHDLDESERWRSIGRRVLLEQLPIHVRPDGTYFEQSTWYHRYTLDFYLHFWLLAQSAGDALPSDVGDAIGRLGVVVAYVSRPDGSMPLIGDDDGGRLLSLDGRTSGDPRPALANAGLVASQTALGALGQVTAETVWLLGPGAASGGAVATAAAPPLPTSRYFADGGLIVMRDGWGQRSSVLVLDAGPHGAHNCGHAHADALSFDLTVNGIPLLSDPGTMAYTTAPTTRDRFRATASHNAATIDGANSSEMAGPFSWRRRATTRVMHWSAHPLGDFAAGVHDGFGHTPETLTPGYERVVVRIPVSGGGCWVVRDRYTSPTPDDVTLTAHVQCARGITVHRLDADSVQLRRGADAVADLLTPGVPLRLASGLVSSLYGVSEPAPQLTAAVRGRCPLTVCTLIGPAGVELTTFANEPNATVLGVVTPTAEVVVILAESGEVTYEGITVEARAFWAEIDLHTRVARWWRAIAARRVTVTGGVGMDSLEPRDAEWIGHTPIPTRADHVRH